MNQDILVNIVCVMEDPIDIIKMSKLNKKCNRIMNTKNFWEKIIAKKKILYVGDNGGEKEYYMNFLRLRWEYFNTNKNELIHEYIKDICVTTFTIYKKDIEDEKDIELIIMLKWDGCLVNNKYIKILNNNFDNIIISVKISNKSILFKTVDNKLYYCEIKEEYIIDNIITKIEPIYIVDNPIDFYANNRSNLYISQDYILYEWIDNNINCIEKVHQNIKNIKDISFGDIPYNYMLILNRDGDLYKVISTNKTYEIKISENIEKIYDGGFVVFNKQVCRLRSKNIIKYFKNIKSIYTYKTNLYVIDNNFILYIEDLHTTDTDINLVNIMNNVIKIVGNNYMYVIKYPKI